jgi:hypothetical protein
MLRKNARNALGRLGTSAGENYSERKPACADSAARGVVIAIYLVSATAHSVSGLLPIGQQRIQQFVVQAQGICHEIELHK